MKILFITTGLQSGGAEKALVQLVTHLDPDEFSVRVVSLTDGGPVYGDSLERQGFALHCLGTTRHKADPTRIADVARIMREWQPDIVQTWMYHADLTGSVAALFSGKPQVVWSVHHTDLHPDKSSRQTRFVAAINRTLSKWAVRKIVCCSNAAADHHREFGYESGKLLVIPNGIDIDEFVPDTTTRISVREELGIGPDAPLIGLIARFDPQKDHDTFFKAAKLLHVTRPDTHFLLCGGEITESNHELVQMIGDSGFQNNVHLLGPRTDIPRLTAALDIATCCSYFGESFSLTLAEALACGVSCVTTAMAGPMGVVAQHGTVVALRSPEELSDAWCRILEDPLELRQERGVDARSHVVSNFSMQSTVSSYAELYGSIKRELTARKIHG